MISFNNCTRKLEYTDIHTITIMNCTIHKIQTPDYLITHLFILVPRILVNASPLKPYLRLIRIISFFDVISYLWLILKTSPKVYYLFENMDIFSTNLPSRIESDFVHYFFQLWCNFDSWEIKKMPVTVMKRRKIFYHQKRERLKNCSWLFMISKCDITHQCVSKNWKMKW